MQEEDDTVPHGTVGNRRATTARLGAFSQQERFDVLPGIIRDAGLTHHHGGFWQPGFCNTLERGVGMAF